MRSMHFLDGDSLSTCIQRTQRGVVLTRWFRDGSASVDLSEAETRLLVGALLEWFPAEVAADKVLG